MRRVFRTIKKWIVKFLGMKLRYRLICVYVIGGLLPMIAVGAYLINGTSEILIKQAKDTEVTELWTMKRQLLETVNTVTSVSRYFYFDEKLENIASRNYEDYQDVVTDYKEYTAFGEYSSYYNDIIRWISIYLDNDSIVGNSRFVEMDEDLVQRQLYQDALAQKGGVIWREISMITGPEKYFSLARLVRTEKKEDVGVLVIHVRDEKLQEILGGRETPTYLFLNGNTLVTSNIRTPDEEEVEYLTGLIKEQQGMDFCTNVRRDGEEYVATGVSIDLEETEDSLFLLSMQSNSSILEEANRQSLNSILFFAGSILISVVLIGLYSRAFSNRVEKFRLQMQKAAAGDFKLEKEISGNDEISDLYQYLGTMIWSIQSLLAEIYREQLQKEKLKIRQKDVEFKMLASQINPHFLYNTLETIRMKARSEKQYEIEELVKMLAKILRRNIQAGNKLVTVKSEADLLGYYLKIQQYRFGERIQYSIDVEPEVENMQILPLLMQPLVENSIVHGLEMKEGIGHITVKIRKEDNFLSVQIEDDGMGIPYEKLDKLREEMKHFDDIDRTHIGVVNVYQRIKLFYGENYDMTFDSQEGKGTKIQLKLPLDFQG